MSTNEQLKDIVRQKYSEIAHQDKSTNQASCCGSGCCSPEEVQAYKAAGSRIESITVYGWKPAVNAAE